MPELYRSVLRLPDLVTDDVATIPPGRRDLGFPLQQPLFDGAGLGYGYAGGSLRTLTAFAADSLAHRERLAQMTAVHPSAAETSTGLGWRVSNDDPLRRVWHTGMVPGYFSAIHLIPQENLAVVMVTNRSGFADQQQLYDASAGLLAIARDQKPPEPGLPTTTVGILAAAGASGALAMVLLGRRGRAPRVAGLVLAGVVGLVPTVLALLEGMRWDAGLLWAPTVTVFCWGHSRSRPDSGRCRGGQVRAG